MAAYSVHIIRERCKGCHLCIHFCEFDVLTAEDTVNEHGYFSVRALEPDTCRGCGACYAVCPDMAIEIRKKDEGKGK